MNIFKIVDSMKSQGIDTELYVEEMHDSIQKFDEMDKDYELRDCVLIRTTNIFPNDKVIQTPKNCNAYCAQISNLFESSIEKMLLNKNNGDRTKMYEELSQYEILKHIKRSTVHFTINGLVSSHPYGNFDNRSFIIIDPLVYHIDNPSICGLRVEDTYFDDDINLSNESIILIPVSDIYSVIANPEYIEVLKKFRVVVFDGDEQHAVEHVLRSKGYDCFLINNHGYVDGIKENKMLDFIDKLAIEKGACQDRHCYSEVRQTDFDSQMEEDRQSDILYLNFILDNILIDEEFKKNILYVCSDKDNQFYKNELIDKLIDLIGLEQLKVLTKEYNEQFKKRINATNKKR